MFAPHQRQPGTPQNPLDEVVVTNPTGGLGEAASIDNLGDTQATEALNVEFAEGTIAKRRGSVKVGDQVNPSAWSVERIPYWGHQYVTRAGVSTLLAVFGTHLYKKTGGTWVGAVSGVNPAGATDVFGGGNNLGCAVQINDVVYYGDGDVTKRYNGTTIRDWSYAGGTLPAAVLDAGVPGGALLAGAYTLVWTLYDSATGEETNPSTVSNSRTVALNDRALFHIAKPAGYTTNFDLVRIYRTFAAGAGAWYFEAQHSVGNWVSGGSTEIAQDITVADSSLGAEVAYDNDPAPKWRYFQLHDERVVGGHIGTTAPSQVAWSKAGAPFAVPALNAQYLQRDDGHPIRGVFKALYGNLFVGKQGGPLFQLSPHPTLGYAPLMLPALHGLESHHSVIAGDNGALFEDRLGLVSFNGQQTRLISGPVQETFRRLAAQVDTSASGEKGIMQRVFGIHDQQADRSQARWAFALTTTDLVSDDQLVVDLESTSGEAGAWHREQYKSRGLRVFFAVVDPAASGQKTPAIYALDGNGQCWRLRTDESNVEVFADDGAAYTMTWYSKWFGDGLNAFLPRFIDVELEISAAGATTGNVSVTLWKDGDESAPVQTKTIALASTGPVVRTVRFDIAVVAASSMYWRRLRVGFSHSSANGDVSIVKFTVLGKMIGRRLLGAA